MSHEVAEAAVAGSRPAILIPAALLELPADELAQLLRHERGLIERDDPARALLQRIIEDLYWWNPAMARLGNHIREAQVRLRRRRRAGRSAGLRTFACVKPGVVSPRRLRR